MPNSQNLITGDIPLLQAARAAQRATKACRQWENGGSPENVSSTADEATIAMDLALTAIQSDDDIVLTGVDPGTRRARLVLAAYMLLLAGTDEHGESLDLASAATLIRRAAVM